MSTNKQKDIITGKVINIVNSNTMELEIEYCDEDNFNAYANLEYIVITDIPFCSAIYRNGRKIKRILKTNFGRKTLRIEVDGKDKKGNCRTEIMGLSIIT
ncbi:MAG: hypothetical protein PF444_04455 [Bacteroidales bacterium]|jgi:hypothetical protein|nr:hypothetical protein [Bacteroidales bacterium]